MLSQGEFATRTGGGMEMQTGVLLSSVGGIHFIERAVVKFLHVDDITTAQIRPQHVPCATGKTADRR